MGAWACCSVGVRVGASVRPTAGPNRQGEGPHSPLDGTSKPRLEVREKNLERGRGRCFALLSWVLAYEAVGGDL